MNARMRTQVGRLTFSAVLVALLTALLAPTAANAGLLVPAVDCEDQLLSRPFTPWLDPMRYTMPAGGSFEDGATGWTLKRGAAIVDGNETYWVHGTSDSHSLTLPRGSSATSSTVCVGIEHPTLRFFARNSGSLLSTLRVDVRFFDAGGIKRILPIGLVLGNGAWQPTLPYPVLANLLPLLPGDHTPVAFKFTPQGIGGAWRIDDVYVDPYRRS
jgi:hypothetical protein